MDHLDVLLDIQKSLGNLESSQTNHGAKLTEIHEQVKYTNGRVNKLRSDVDGLLKDGTGKKKDNFNLSINKERLLLVFGSIAYIISLVVEQLRP